MVTDIPADPATNLRHKCSKNLAVGMREWDCAPAAPVGQEVTARMRKGSAPRPLGFPVPTVKGHMGPACTAGPAPWRRTIPPPVGKIS